MRDREENVYRQITIYFQQHQKDQLSELFNTKLEMHHCWVSFFLEVITKTLSLPAQRTRMSVGRLGTVVFLVRDKQNSLHERHYFHLLSNSTQSANRSSSKCLRLFCGRQEEKRKRQTCWWFPLLHCFFLVMLNPPCALDTCRRLCKQVL